MPKAVATPTQVKIVPPPMLGHLIGNFTGVLLEADVPAASGSVTEEAPSILQSVESDFDDYGAEIRASLAGIPLPESLGCVANASALVFATSEPHGVGAGAEVRDRPRPSLNPRASRSPSRYSP